MELNYKNSKEDLFLYYLYFIKNQTAIRTYKKFKLILTTLIGIFISISILFFRWNSIVVNEGLMPEDILFIAAPIVIGLLLSLLFWGFSTVINREKFDEILKKIDLDINEDISLKIVEEGVIVTTEGKEIIYFWKFIKDIIEENNNIYITFKNNRGLVIPLNAFSEEVSKEQLINKVKNNIK